MTAVALATAPTFTGDAIGATACDPEQSLRESAIRSWRDIALPNTGGWAGSMILFRTSHPTAANVTTSTGTKRSLPISLEDIAARIVLIRGQRVLIDADLAALYGVDTRRLNEQVRRNAARFPADFMLTLTASEFANLMSQIATSSSTHGGRRKIPTAFTEHGALMAATILNSDRARDVSIYVVRAFVQLRGLLASNAELARQLKELEQRLEQKVQHQDQTIARILDAIHRLMNPPEPKRRQIGFTEPDQRGRS